MKSHILPLFAAAAGVLLASSGQADQNLTGNTVVEGRLGVGLPVTSPVTVPLSNFQVNGSALLRASWPALAWQDSATGQAFATRYINNLNCLQFYWDPAYPSGDNRAFMSVGEDLGVTISRSDYARGFNLHVRTDTNHNGALGLSSETGRNPGITFMDYGFNYRTTIAMDELTGTHALKFYQLTLASTPTWVTVMGMYPNTTGGNVAIGSQVPTEKLDVVGNIKASGTISAANPTAATHVVTLDWLKTQSRIPERGDISMGEFTEGPAP
jgi:hypothetical protein